MKDRIFLIFIFFVLGTFTHSNIHINTNFFHISTLNHLEKNSNLEFLGKQNMIQTNYSECLNAVQSLLKNNTKNTQFKPFLEFSGKGLYSLGNFHNCSNSKNMTYFYINVVLSPPSFVVMNYGACVPNICTNDTLYLALKQVLKSLLPIPIPLSLIVSITDSKSKNQNMHKKYFGFYISMTLVIIYFFVVLASTIRKYLTHLLSSEKGSQEMKSTKIMIFDCFNLKDNIEGIFKTENRLDPKLNVLHFIRCLGMFWVILGHYYSFSIQCSNSNLIQAYNEIMGSKGMAILRNGTVSVDIFFFLSGFLSTMAFVASFEKEQFRTLKNLLLFYFHRYVRLFPFMIISWIITVYVMPQISNGVNTSSVSYNQQLCQERFIPTFLYIDNLVTHMYNFCNGWIWYLYIDMQLFIITPLFVYPALKKINLALLLLLFASLSSFLYQILIFQTNHLSASVTTMGNPLFEHDFYQQTYARCNVYFIGMLFCFLYFESKDKKSFKCLFLTSFNHIIRYRIIRYFIYIFGVILMIISIFGQNWFDHAMTLIPQYQNTMFLLLNREVFVLGMTLIIYPAMLGFSRPIYSIFGFSLFNVLGKLTYGSYMLHLFLMTLALLGLQLNYSHYEFYLAFSLGLGFYAMVYLLSLFCTALFESPIVQLLKLLTESQKKKLTTHQAVKDPEKEV